MASRLPWRDGNSTRRWSTSRSGWLIQRRRGFSASRSQSPSRLTLNAIMISTIPGKMVIHHSPDRRKSLPTRIKSSKRRRCRRDANAQERQCRLDDDCGGQLDRCQHQHRAHHVGQDMTAHDSQRRHADHARRLHILLLPFDHRRATDGARILNPAAKRDGDDQHREGQRIGRIRKDGTADAVDQQRDQDRRERQHHVAHPHDEGIDPAADETPTAGRAKRRPAARRRPKRRRRTAIFSSRTSRRTRCRAPDRRYRASSPTLPSSMPGRRQPRIRQFEAGQIERIVRRDEVGENRTENAQESDQRCRDRHRRLLEAVPDVAFEKTPEAAGRQR